MHRNEEILEADEEENKVELTPEEVVLLEQEISRREEVLNNIIQAALENQPAAVHRYFDDEIKHRLAGMLDEYKTELAYNLVKDAEPEEELTNEDLEILDQIVNLTEEEVDEIMEDPEISDEDKELIQQIIDAANEEEDDGETA